MKTSRWFDNEISKNEDSFSEVNRLMEMKKMDFKEKSLCLASNIEKDGQV